LVLELREEKIMQGNLVSRNVTIQGHRTSIRLEKATWSALDQICSIENKSIHDICTLIEQFRRGSSRTSLVRAFIVTYFRAAANMGGKLEGGNVPAALELTAGSGVR